MDSPDEKICSPGESQSTNNKTLRDRRGSRRTGTLTCANCRSRKPPPITQVIEMARRLQEAEKTITKLQATGASICIWSPFESSAAQDEQQVPVALPPPTARMQIGDHAGSNLTKESAYISCPLPASTGMNHLHPDSQAKAPSDTNTDVPTETTEVQTPGISVDDREEICHHGPTSAVYDPSAAANHLSTTPAFTTRSAPLVRVVISSYLASYRRESLIWEDFALGNASLQTGMPLQMMAKLLHVHWTWVSPMFAWVHRPAFIRDMATRGRYYSEFLLIVICAHAAKYQQGECTALLLARARSLLGAAIQQPSSIPTGNISQAWIYSGIAFRMANDLGLQHCGPDIRLLYCVDNSADQDSWVPYYHDSIDLTKLGHGHYPPTRAHLVGSFINSCRLSIIINDIIIQLYSCRIREGTQIAFKDIKDRLHLWRTHSPAHLKYDPDNLLLALCVGASRSIEKLILLLESTFGLENITYLMEYCIYTSTSAILEEAKGRKGNAFATLQTFLRILNVGMKKCPMLKRSLDIIIKGLSRVNETVRPLGRSGSARYDAGLYLDVPLLRAYDGHGI
ncbi:hypothetical protein F5B21DRAFT_518684 [Xylaria acuta]|nr:hypothetical protein F5B21DRAFT_518684 [Xylaria acuta]